MQLRQFLANGIHFLEISLKNRFGDGKTARRDAHEFYIDSFHSKKEAEV